MIEKLRMFSSGISGIFEISNPTLRGDDTSSLLLLLFDVEDK